MMKDEAGGKIIEVFVGFKANLYSYKMFEGKEEKKCKGVKKSEVKKKITQDDYKEHLSSGNIQMRSMNVVSSHVHEVFTEKTSKLALSANDDKRKIKEYKISTFAHVHYQLHR